MASGLNAYSSQDSPVMTIVAMTAWTIVPVHAGRRVLAEVRHALACRSAARLGARHARHLLRAAGIEDLANQPDATNVTQNTTDHKAR